MTEQEQIDCWRFIARKLLTRCGGELMSSVKSSSTIVIMPVKREDEQIQYLLTNATDEISAYYNAVVDSNDSLVADEILRTCKKMQIPTTPGCSLKEVVDFIAYGIANSNK